MQDEFKPINGEDDVLSLDNTMLKVGQIKQELIDNFHKIVREQLNYGRFLLSLSQYSRSSFIKANFTNVNCLSSPREGINCEVLKVGAKNWEKGKLRIEVILEFLPTLEEFQYKEAKKMSDELRRKNMYESDIFKINVNLEFCPDEPKLEEPITTNQPEITPPESPLDDLRQLLNQNNQQ